MKIKTTAIIFALFMALQFIAAAQTSDVKDDSRIVNKQPVERTQAVEKSAAPAEFDAVKSAETKETGAEVKSSGCCKGQASSGCTGHKDGKSGCCKDKAKSGEGCQHKHGDAKSSGCQGHTKATGDAAKTDRPARSCCTR
jgi:hypothetical protein